VMPKLDLKITEDGMSYNREGVWTAQEVQDKLGEYLESGGDPQLLVHFMISTKFWYDRAQGAKIFHPGFFVLGFLACFIIMRYF
jgi:hypothetical protein